MPARNPHARRSFFCLLLLGTFVAVCPPDASAYKKIHVFMPKSPPVELGAVEKIAVLDLPGQDALEQTAGRFIAQKIVAHLVTEDRGLDRPERRPFFSGPTSKVFAVVERERIDQVLEELGFNASGMISDQDALRIGELAGAQAILVGSWIEAAVSEKQGTYTVSTSGKHYLKRTVSVDAAIRILEVETAQILFAGEEESEASDSAPQGSPVDPPEMLAEECASEIALKLVDQFTPTFDQESFEFDKVKREEIKDEAERAAKAGEERELDEAYSILSKLLQSDEFNPKLLYNLGILHEVAGQFEKAAELYRGAFQLRDDGKYRKAIERIEQVRIPMAAFFAARGRPLVPFEFQKKEVARVVRTKGDFEDRWPVRESPDPNAVEITGLPGSVEIQILEEGKTWCRIRVKSALKEVEGFIETEALEGL